MMYHFTAEELQRKLRELGDHTVQVTTCTEPHHDYYLLTYVHEDVKSLEDFLPLGLPCSWPIDADGGPVDPICLLTDEERAQLRQVLQVTERIHDVEAAVGEWRDDVFWLYQPGSHPTHILVSIYYCDERAGDQPIRSETLFDAFNEQNRSVWSHLNPQHPCIVDGKPGGTFLAQSQHILPIRDELLSLLHPDALFSES